MPRNPSRVIAAIIRPPSMARHVLAAAAWLALGLPIVTAQAQDELQQRKFSVEAPALTGITIDGDLKDWPAAMPRYSVSKILIFRSTYGYGGLEKADLSTSPDLSVAFSVAYDPKKQLIYLAVIVRDDKLVVGNTSYLDSDAVEVYIDGSHSERQIPFPRPEQMPWWEKMDLSAVPVQQYIAIPGPGRVYGTNYDTNPILMAGDLKKTRTQMAFRREGDVTTYEWAIQPFDQYPNQSTQLKPGKRIGFDLAVVDRDVPAASPEAKNDSDEDRPAYVYWGPQWNGTKAFNAADLGELVLGKLGDSLSSGRSAAATDPERPGAVSAGTTRSDERLAQAEGLIRALTRELKEMVETQDAQLNRTKNTLTRAERLLEALDPKPK